MPTRTESRPQPLPKSQPAKALQNTLVVSREDYQRLSDLIERYQSGRLADAAADLEDELARATVLEPQSIPPDIVRMGSKVRFRFVDTNESREVTLVYPGEASVDEGRISILAPIGTALIGLGVGQRISWSTPEGARVIEVVAVKNDG